MAVLWWPNIHTAKDCYEMKAIRLGYLLTLLVLTALWLAADPILTTGYDFFAFRELLINYTGVLAIGTMSLAMLLAIRLVNIESLLGGLDKSYRLHKWLGITGLIFAFAHFLMANVPKMLVGAGWLAEPAPKTVLEPSSIILQWFQSQYGLAEEFGDWGFKIFVALMLIALLKKFPYRFFMKTHQLLAVVYLFLVFHSLVLIKFSYWDQAIAPVTAILMVAGSAAAFISLFGLVGYQRRTVGEIDRLQYHEDNSVLKIAIRLKGNWAGHEEGQFAFVTFDRREGAHPFTITSPWKNDGIVSFFVKGLGDYTKNLPETLKAGDVVTVEGPYGRFGFDNDKSRQIWVAGGIGIAPFVARIKALIEQPDGKVIDLFYSASRSEDPQFLERLRTASSEANVHLHVVDSAKDGRLNAERICQTVPEWEEADFWFCGPAAFGQSLQEDLAARGLPSGDFHQELFDMR
jgi:predicted ferric reductase